MDKDCTIFEVDAPNEKLWTKSCGASIDCVFKKCCKNYKKGKRCKKCPKK
jgi:hypothetical protein